MKTFLSKFIPKDQKKWKISVNPDDFKFPDEWVKANTKNFRRIDTNYRLTKPEKVGQLNELFKEYAKSSKEQSILGWKNWFENIYSDGKQTLNETFLNFRHQASEDITDEQVWNYVYFSIFVGSFIGFEAEHLICSELDAVQASTDMDNLGVDIIYHNLPYQVKSKKQYPHSKKRKKYAHLGFIVYDWSKVCDGEFTFKIIDRNC